MEKISFIGAGSMAEAVIAGIVKQGIFAKDQVFVMNKDNAERLQALEAAYGVQTSNARAEVIQDADVIVMATKPQDLKQALSDIASLLTSKQLLISVVAGVSTDAIVQYVGKELAVIRTMPNTSATIGYSATAICKGRYATDQHMRQALQLFESIGTVSVVEEKDMHIVTGVSGSGPAYIYYLVEAMEEAAKQEGLDEATAKQLISQTIIGAGKMLQKRSESASTLREQVTSPNGTTAAGIERLQAYRFKEAVISCVFEATRRSEELGQENEA